MRKKSLFAFALFLILGVSAAFVAWYASIKHKEKKIEKSIEAIEKAGAQVQLGVASEEYYITLNDSSFNDDKLEAIIPYVKEIGPLANLNLRDTQISDRSVDLLAQCDVGVLVVTHTKMSAKGITKLRKRLPNTFITHETTLSASEGILPWSVEQARHKNQD